MRFARSFSCSRSSLISVLGLLSLLCLTSCATPHGADGGSDGPSYDGISDTMDSLPDCGPDSQGSLFWVREKNTAFECSKASSWKERKNARKPDDADEKKGDTGEVSPRIVN